MPRPLTRSRKNRLFRAVIAVLPCVRTIAGASIALERPAARGEPQTELLLSGTRLSGDQSRIRDGGRYWSCDVTANGAALFDGLVNAAGAKRAPFADGRVIDGSSGGRSRWSHSIGGHLDGSGIR